MKRFAPRLHGVGAGIEVFVPTRFVPGGGMRFGPPEQDPPLSPDRLYLEASPRDESAGDPALCRAALEEDSAIFLRFADITGDPTRADAFASAYGQLFAPLGGSQKEPAKAENLAQWFAEAARIGAALDLWEQARDTREDGPQRQRDLSLLLSREIADAARLDFELEDGQPRANALPRLALVPRTLRDLIWLRFAEAVARDREFRRCRRCREWFEVAHDASTRSTRIYCSNACRLATYRERAAIAEHLYKEGNTVEEIAVTLQASPEAVAGWVLGGPPSVRARRAKRSEGRAPPPGSRG